MIVRRKSVIFAFSLIFFLTLFTWLFSYLIISRSFIRVENRSVERNILRVRDILSARIHNLDSLLLDWAAWDDTCKFIEDTNKEFISSNLNQATFSSLKIDYIIFLDLAGKKVFSSGYDEDTGKEIPVPDGLWDYIKKNPRFSVHSNTESAVSGVIVLPEGAFLAASRPIIDSKQQGPVRGTLIFCRRFGAGEVSAISEIIKLPIEVTSAGPAVRDAASREAGRELPGNGVRSFLRVAGRENIAAYALVKDVSGEPPREDMNLSTSRDPQ